MNKVGYNSLKCPFLDLVVLCLYRKLKFTPKFTFSFPLVIFAFLNGSFIRGKYFLACSLGTCLYNDVSHYNKCILCITDKLLSQGFCYQKLLKIFIKSFVNVQIWYQHLDLLASCNYLMKNSISQPLFTSNDI